jgi:hypothetical protein
VKICTPKLEVSKTLQISKEKHGPLSKSKIVIFAELRHHLFRAFSSILCVYNVALEATVVRLAGAKLVQIASQAAAELICLHCTMPAQAKDINLQQPFFYPTSGA